MRSARIAFVVQRYGQDVIGGSELHCRQVAERLSAAGYDCTVYTTSARDYLSWKNEYPSGESVLNGVVIKRFPVDRERHIDTFNSYSDWIFFHEHTQADEIKWMEMQGPFSPRLIDALEDESPDYDVLIFFTYLYYNTYWGLKRSRGKKALVPTAHDEPALGLELMKEVFSEPGAFIFNTQAEKEMLSSRFSFAGKYQDTVGVGVDVDESPVDTKVAYSYGILHPFLLYAGRIEPGKGCQTLIDYFLELNTVHPDVILAFIGKKLMELPDHPNIRYLGFVPAEHKTALMASAVSTVHPSPYESLCMAALESMAVCTPIMVREQTAPLKRHALDGKSGLYYANYSDFEAGISLLLNDARLRDSMGRNGREYVKKNYSWTAIMGKYDRVIEFLMQD